MCEFKHPTHEIKAERHGRGTVKLLACCSNIIILDSLLILEVTNATQVVNIVCTVYSGTVHNTVIYDCKFRHLDAVGDG